MSKVKTDQGICIELDYLPPYDWELMMNFFKSRSIPGVDYVTEDGIYRRSLLIDLESKELSGWIEVKPLNNKNCLQLLVSQSLEPGLSQIIKQVKKAFDLDLNPNVLPSDLPKGIRLPGCFDLFELSSRVILGQQISVKAARTLAKRMVDLIGIPMESPFEEVKYHFPTPEVICHLDRPINDVLGEIGVIKNRSQTILSIAKEILNNHLNLSKAEDFNDIRHRLMSIKGIGPWSAEYLLMRGYSVRDAFLVTDLGIKNSLARVLVDEDGDLLLENTKKPVLSKYMLNKKYIEEALKYAYKYKPYRSYYNISLWQSLSDN